MILAFYKVDNSLNYERDSFNGMGSDEVLESLRKLQDDEYLTYDMDDNDDPLYFREDFNEEYLDSNSWWCVIMR